MKVAQASISDPEQSRGKEREQDLPWALPSHPEQFSPGHFTLDLLGPQKDFKQYLIVNGSRPSIKKQETLHKHQLSIKTGGSTVGLEVELLRRF